MKSSVKDPKITFGGAVLVLSACYLLWKIILIVVAPGWAVWLPWSILWAMLGASLITLFIRAADLMESR